MRKLLYLLLPLLALAACTPGIDNNLNDARQGKVPGDHAHLFYATVEGPVNADSPTKVFADQDMRVLWNADDRISIFDKMCYNQEYAFLGQTGDNAGEFSPVDGNPDGNSLPYVYAVYPYRTGTGIDGNGQISMTLPDTQAYLENSFGLGANTMVSVTEDDLLRFKNTCGFLSFKLYGNNVSVRSITLKGNNHEKLAGPAVVTMALNGTPTVTMQDGAKESVTLSCSNPVALESSAEKYTEFWFVIPPTDFTKGLTVTITDNYNCIFEKSTDNAISVRRNTLSRMSPVQLEDGNAVWSIIGSFSAWDDDLTMTETEPGIWVSPGFDITDEDQFKLRFHGDWTVNLGGAFVKFGEPFSAAYNGQNILVGSNQHIQVKLDFTDKDNPTITINPSEPTVWSVIGDFNDWSADLDMTEMKLNVWVSPTFSTKESNDGGFKLRLNGSWENISLGGPFTAFDTPFSAVEDGDPIVVGDDKNIQVTLDKTDPAHPTITVTEVVKPITWSVIGSFNDWSYDLFMEETSSGIWESPVFTTPDNDTQGFQIRRDCEWTIHYGGSFVEFGTPFVADDSPDGMVNINVGSQQDIKVRLDLTDPDNPMITVFKFKKSWSVIGDFCAWTYDLFMEETSPGIWESPEFDAGDIPQFKLRFDKDWSINLGGTFVSYGTPFAAVSFGDNITLETRAVVKVTLNLTDPENPTITVTKPSF